MTGRRLDRATREAAERALAAAARHLLSFRSADGAIHRPCAGRAVESALALHLTRDQAGREGWHGRLRGFCERAWSAEPPAAPGESTARRVDRAVRRALLALALRVERPCREAAVADLREALDGFRHPSHDRKIAVFERLVAELAPEMACPSRTRFDGSRAHQVAWTQLLLDAVDQLGAATPNEATLDAVERAQGADGSWHHHHFAGLVALLALRRGGRTGAAFERALDHLERETRTDGGVPFIPDLDLWTSGLTGFFLARGGWTTELAPVADYVARQQHPDGTWSFASGVELSDLDDTALATIFLEATGGARHRPAIERALDSVPGNLNADGGFTTYVRGAASEVEITARALQAMGIRPQRFTAPIAGAVAWLEDAQEADGSYAYEWTLSPEFPVSQVALALARDGVDGPAAARVVERSTRFLLDRQGADGAWVDDRGTSQVLPTAYALIALGAGRLPETAEARARGLRYLLDAQRPDGSFASPPDEIAPRPLIYEMDLFPTIYAAGALVGCLRADRGLSPWASGWTARPTRVPAGHGDESGLAEEIDAGGDGRNRTDE